MINNKICVFDFETDGSDPSVCSPVQLSAVMVDVQRLEIIKDSEFNAFLKPERIESNSNPSIDIYSDSDILEWHGKIKGVDKTEIFGSWLEYPDQKYTWQQFTSYLDNYHNVFGKKSKSQFSAPVACGYNIIKFDMKIINRLSQKYGNVNKENYTNLFHPRDQVDLMNVMWLWFENVSEIKSLSLDNMRDYLGIDKTNAHDALKDVKDCANILLRFLRLHRKLAPKIQFKGSFANNSLC